MKPYRNILVTTDTRLDRHPIVDEAVEMAWRNDARLKLVDVVPPLSWFSRMTLEDPDHVAQLMIEEKAKQLEELAVPILAKGVHIETKVLHGATSVEIIREVMRGGHDLTMRVAKAKSSRRKGFFGKTGIELLRKCPGAVWLVSPKGAATVRHVMACIETRVDREVDIEVDRAVYHIARDLSERHGSDLSVVHAWSIEGEQFLRKRTSRTELAKINAGRLQQAKERLGKVLAGCQADLAASQIHTIKGEPYHAIPEFANFHDVDLLVMGLAGHRGPAGWILGSVTEQVLNAIECSVLAVKPSGFVSPIRPDNSSNAIPAAKSGM